MFNKSTVAIFSITGIIGGGVAYFFRRPIRALFTSPKNNPIDKVKRREQSLYPLYLYTLFHREEIGHLVESIDQICDNQICKEVSPGHWKLLKGDQVANKVIQYYKNPSTDKEAFLAIIDQVIEANKTSSQQDKVEGLERLKQVLIERGSTTPTTLTTPITPAPEPIPAPILKMHQYIDVFPLPAT